MQIHKGWIRYTELAGKSDKTVGQLAQEQDKNVKYDTHCAQDQVDEELKDFMPEVFKCIKNGKKHFDGDFYIEVLLCMPGVIERHKKNIFAARPTCPRPFYDQTVFKYHSKDDRLEYMWTVPDKDLCELYRYHIGIVPDDEKELYDNIKKYFSGELAIREYKENNKEPEKQVIPVTRS